ncbi:MAG: acetate kinase [Parcubacteria group bacterium]|nr:acetate kinase [Parcubacteria group bacterium]|tara:strand:+ start:9257 stop:10429 length:1173 start_codon:yes stop_codon:yes gene_type:complete
MSKLKKYILVVNSGSATLKFKIFNQENFEVAVTGIVEKIGLPGSFIAIEEKSSKRMMMKNYPGGIDSHQQALEVIFSFLKHWKRKIKVIGHRIVHGGQNYTKPTILTKSVLAKLKEYNQLAPLHNPINLSCVNICLKDLPSIKNVAVFDTAFYKTVPEHAFLYAIPYKYYKELGIRRYGFHGISHQYVANKTAEKLNKPLKKLRLITCHLGSGSSVTAIKFGKPIDTSMGFTPLEGVTMGTRSGDIDPSVAFYLMDKLDLDVREVEKILNQKSGLKGIFGYSNDMRDIMIAAGYKIKDYKATKKFNLQEQKQGKLALAMYIYDIVRYIGGYTTVMGGIDYIIFTGGIGERNQTVRNLITKQVRKAWPKVKSLAIPTNEELMIAQQVNDFS